MTKNGKRFWVWTGKWARRYRRQRKFIIGWKKYKKGKKWFRRPVYGTRAQRKAYLARLKAKRLMRIKMRRARAAARRRQQQQKGQQGQWETVTTWTWETVPANAQLSAPNNATAAATA